VYQGLIYRVQGDAPCALRIQCNNILTPQQWQVYHQTLQTKEPQNYSQKANSPRATPVSEGLEAHTYQRPQQHELQLAPELCRALPHPAAYTQRRSQHAPAQLLQHDRMDLKILTPLEANVPTHTAGCTTLQPLLPGKTAPCGLQHCSTSSHQGLSK